MSYFDDALFIGDSLTQGFQVYTSGISNASYAAYIGAGPRTFIEGTVTNIDGETVKPIDEILAASPKKVYILLGTNAMETLTDEAFLEYYGRFLGVPGAAAAGGHGVLYRGHPARDAGQGGRRKLHAGAHPAA